MILHDLGAIFIHVPKTAGNYLTNNYLLRYSRDYKLVRGHQDGINRFEIRGDLTEGKHMTLRQYKDKLDLSQYFVICSIRNPLERLISLYFSPHRAMREKASARLIRTLAEMLGIDLEIGYGGYKEKPLRFEPGKFRLLLKDAKTFQDYLAGYEESKGLFVIENESVEQDLCRVTHFLGRSMEFSRRERLNKSRATINRDNIALAREIMSGTKHEADYRFLDEIRKVAVNLQG